MAGSNVAGQQYALADLLRMGAEQGASDLVITTGKRPTIAVPTFATVEGQRSRRLRPSFVEIPEAEREVREDEAYDLILSSMTPNQRTSFVAAMVPREGEEHAILDFHYDVQVFEEIGRFRAMASKVRGEYRVVFRYLTGDV